ncbi:MAG: DUF1036 domain-containing protein [Puniceicoccaceae bacterium]|nr:DUF1036 domain-containing protein [Puniceicoccaceae bacterium]
MRKRTTLAALIVVALTLPPERIEAQSNPEFRICNEGDSTLMIAMLVRHWVFLSTRWESRGWFHISPGQCERWSYGNAPTIYLLSVTRRTNEGREVLDYGVDTIPRTFRHSTQYGTESFYCVSDDAFRRKNTTLEAFEKCSTGEYLQLFNLQVHVGTTANFSLWLGG